MANRKIRMEQLKQAGLEKGKFFSLVIPEGVKAGDVLRLQFGDDSGKENTDWDEITSQIQEDGFVHNPVLFRRWVMAQMFRGLKYKNYIYGEGYNAYLNSLDWKYPYKMIIQECKALSKIEKEAGIKSEEYKIRSSFFTKEVIIDTWIDYLAQLKQKHQAMLSKNIINGKEAVIVLNGEAYTKEMLDSLYLSISSFISVAVRSSFGTKKFAKLYRYSKNFYKEYVCKYPLSKKYAKKAQPWKEAYKGAGAYYTLANLVCSHDYCVLDDSAGYSVTLFGEPAMAYVNKKFQQCKEEGAWWKLLGFLKATIASNTGIFYK